MMIIVCLKVSLKAFVIRQIAGWTNQRKMEAAVPIEKKDIVRLIVRGGLCQEIPERLKNDTMHVRLIVRRTGKQIVAARNLYKNEEE